MKSSRSIAAFLRRNGAALLCAAGLFALLYHVAFGFHLYPASADDYRPHMLWAVQLSSRSILASFYNGSYKLWHICVKFVFTYLLPNVWKAAAVVTAAANTAAYLLLFRIWDRALPEKMPRWLLALLCAGVFVAEALTLPGGAFYIRDGVVLGALNTWHNPTNIMVRPFALAVFYMTVNIYNRRLNGRGGILPGPDDNGRFAFAGSFWHQFRQPVFTRKELVLYPLCLLLSAYAKPSFLQFFCPAVFLFLLIDVVRTRGMLLPFCVKLAIPYLPPLLVLIRQFNSVFLDGVTFGGEAAAAVESSITGGPHGVQIAPALEGVSGLGGFLSHFAGDWLPLLLFCALPVFLLLVDPGRGLKNAAVRLGLLGAFAGRLEAVLFHETGSGATHGNFLWGFSLAAWVFWTVSVGQWAQLPPAKTARGKLARYGGAVLLLWHLAAGVAYLAVIMRTHDYLY